MRGDEIWNAAAIDSGACSASVSAPHACMACEMEFEGCCRTSFCRLELWEGCLEVVVVAFCFVGLGQQSMCMFG